MGCKLLRGALYFVIGPLVSSIVKMQMEMLFAAVGGKNRVRVVVFYLYVKLEVIIMHSIIAAMARDNFCTYFNSTQGELSWQYRHVRRTQ